MGNFVNEDLLAEFLPLFGGGMGAMVSGHNMAREISRLGGFGTLSGAGLLYYIVELVRSGNEEVIAMVRTFPFPEYVEELMLFAPWGKWHKRTVPMDQLGERGDLARRLATIAAYTEVRLAKQGHRGKIAINIMWKLTGTVLPTIYGAMLAGIDALVMGAGVPMEAPDMVAKIRAGRDLSYKRLYSTTSGAELKVRAGTKEFLARFARPLLIPILSNYAFCRVLKQEWETKYGYPPDMFILEAFDAGGHNAPPRNKIEHVEETDGIETYFEKVMKLGIPVVVAGASKCGGTRADLLEWQERGAYGIQIGSRFALCEESNIESRWKDRIIANNRRGRTKIVTSYSSSPTSYPLKEVRLNGTLSRESVRRREKPSCKYGFLRQGTERDSSVLSCPAMPLAMYRKLNPDKTLAECHRDRKGKVCLCAGLLATVGMLERPPYITMGLSGRLVVRHQTVRQIMEEILTPEYVAMMEQKLKIAR